MDNIYTCSLDICKKEYDYTLPGESLLGDLNFCSEKCCNIWLALSEREVGKYQVTSKEWCDEILRAITLNPQG